MANLRVSAAAQRDLEDIWIYIASAATNEPTADRVIDKLVDAFVFLASNPGAGHVREDLAPESLRFWNVFSYLVIYRASTDVLEIVRVLHGRQDVQAILGDEG